MAFLGFFLMLMDENEYRRAMDVKERCVVKITKGTLKD